VTVQITKLPLFQSLIAVRLTSGYHVSKHPKFLCNRQRIQRRIIIIIMSLKKKKEIHSAYLFTCYLVVLPAATVGVARCRDADAGTVLVIRDYGAT
jgi:hypothetical protein